MKHAWIIVIYFVFVASACYDFTLHPRDSGIGDGNAADSIISPVTSAVDSTSTIGAGDFGTAGGGATVGGVGGAGGSGTAGLAGAGNATVCVAGINCSPGECQQGSMSCAHGMSECVKTSDAEDGTGCNNGGVCQAGACSACAAGKDCSDANSCRKKTIDCSSGKAVCTPSGNTANGTSCGTNLYCNQGSCKSCTNGASCVPVGKPCNKGIVSCSNGQIECTDERTPVDVGTSCGDNRVCDSAGACVSCTANLTCTPANPCHKGLTSCATGESTCVDKGPLADGKSCDDDNACTRKDVCQNGVCTGTNPVICSASDSCHVAGTCDQQTGKCSSPAAPYGTSCDDGIWCNGPDACNGSGSCVNTYPVNPCTNGCNTACKESTRTCVNETTWNDTTSGLTWEITPTTGGSAMSWSVAKSHCESSTLCGQSGWHLPTISELRSLVRSCNNIYTGGACGVKDACPNSTCQSTGCLSGCTPPAGGVGCLWPADIKGSCDLYWSSTDNPDSQNYWWVVNFKVGVLGNANDSIPHPARCARKP